MKSSNTRKHGAEVILHGQTLEEAARLLVEHGEKRGLTFIHPFERSARHRRAGDHRARNARAAPELEVLVVPIGGGGLISGMAVAAKALKPSIEIIGVETALYPSMYNRHQRHRPSGRGDTLAEGIAVRGSRRPSTARIMSSHVDDIVLVSEAHIERAWTS